MDALALLQHDHDAVRALFARLADVSGTERFESVREIAAEVALHSQLEEEFFSPALEQADDAEACQIAVDARAEHALVDDLIERLLGLDPRQGEFARAVGELERRIQAHARDEEVRIFPVARRALGEARLVTIGHDIKARRARLEAVPDGFPYTTTVSILLHTPMGRSEVRAVPVDSNGPGRLRADGECGRDSRVQPAPAMGGPARRS